MTRPHKALFDLPKRAIHPVGNSLGPLPKGSATRGAKVIKSEWGIELIRAGNNADWISLPKRMVDRIAVLIGALVGSVASADSLYVEKAEIIAGTEIIEEVIQSKIWRVPK